MSEDKILEIIKEQYVFTVKDGNKWLKKRLDDMEKRKLIEFKDSYKDCEYYGPHDGKHCTLKDGFEFVS